jgi:lactate dehydrogenase-like 2-hydroxyacid dehydrogenase
MALIGYGDIGYACAKVAKNGFGMKVTGVKRNPNSVSQE